jgi:hypothetical protein
MFYFNFASELKGSYGGNIVENIESTLDRTVLEEGFSDLERPSGRLSNYI